MVPVACLGAGHLPSPLFHPVQDCGPHPALMASPGVKADGTWAEPEELRCLFAERGEEEEATPVSGGNFLFPGDASHSLTET